MYHLEVPVRVSPLRPNMCIILTFQYVYQLEVPIVTVQYVYYLGVPAVIEPVSPTSSSSSSTCISLKLHNPYHLQVPVVTAVVTLRVFLEVPVVTVRLLP